MAFIWQVGLIAALYGSVRLSQRFIGGGSRRIAMLWTAAVIWMEAPGGGIQVGQIGIFFLMLALLYAAYSSSWWVSGLLVGARRRNQADAGHDRLLSGWHAPLVGCGVLRRRVPRHGGVVLPGVAT